MVRLVTEAGDVAPFIPMLLPALKRAAEETVDTEAAETSKSAIDALTKALGVGHVADRAKAGLTGQWEGKESMMVRIVYYRFWIGLYGWDGMGWDKMECIDIGYYMRSQNINPCIILVFIKFHGGWENVLQVHRTKR